MSKWTMALLAAWMIIFTSSYNPLGKLEGYLFPVITDFKIEQLQYQSNGTKFFGSFYKTRNCTFVETFGTISHGDYLAYIDLDFQEHDKVRIAGKHFYGPWHVRLTSAELKTMRLTSKHNCHWLYETETRLN